MPWGRFDDQYAHNRKVRKLSDQAFRLDVSGILWCCHYTTDGFISDDDLPLVCAEVRNPQRAARELADRRRWERIEGGWYVHDYLDYNPSAEQVAAERELKNARQQRWRGKKSPDASRDGDVDASTDASHNASRDGTTDASRDAAPRARVPVPYPSPTPTTSPSSAGAEGDTPSRRRRTARSAPPDGFAVFWDAYPRKVAKAAAEKAYARALANGADPALILAGAEFYALERKLQDPKFTKHPATWLNGHCWDDEPDPEYRPPIIGAPSEAATAQPRPWAEVRSEQLGHTSEFRPPPGDDIGNWFSIDRDEGR